MGKDLADQKDVVSASLDRLPDKLLGAAVRIHLGSVNQSHAEIDAEAQRRDLLVSSAGVLGHVPSALTEDENGFPGGKPDGSWRGDYTHGPCSSCLNGAQQ